jgi:hypothetical protein
MLSVFVFQLFTKGCIRIHISLFVTAFGQLLDLHCAINSKPCSFEYGACEQNGGGASKNQHLHRLAPSLVPCLQCVPYPHRWVDPNWCRPLLHRRRLLLKPWSRCHRHLQAKIQQAVLAISYRRRPHRPDTSRFYSRGPTGNPNHCRAFRCSWRRCHHHAHC